MTMIQDQHVVTQFFVKKDLMQKIFTRCFLPMERSVYYLKKCTIRSRNFLKAALEFITKTEARVQQVEELIRMDKKSDYKQQNYNRAFSWFSIQDNTWLFEFQNVCVYFDSQQLTRECKKISMGLSFQYLLQYSDNMLNRIT